MEQHVTGIGVVGVGAICPQYVETLRAVPDVEVRFLAARSRERAHHRAEELDVSGAGTFAEMLADPSVEIVLNLTVPRVHAEITEQAMLAGRHVYSEKPLALTEPDGRRLVELAARRGLALGCAPDTFLGAGLQTALRTIRSGSIGTPRTAFANFQYGGPDLWHPNPEFLFQEGGGPLLDMGPYYLTALVQVFGSVARVSAVAVHGDKSRRIMRGPRAGEQFTVDVPTHVMALYEFVSGGVADVILSFDSPMARIALEITGSSGALRLPDPNTFSGDSELIRADGTSQSVGAAGGPGASTRGAGVVELVRSLSRNSAPRTSGTLALHVLEAMTATTQAARSGRATVVSSRVDPAPLLPTDWSLSGPHHSQEAAAG